MEGVDLMLSKPIMADELREAIADLMAGESED